MHINLLPLELLEKIFEKLSIEERLKASMVCQFWHSAALGSVTCLSCETAEVEGGLEFYSFWTDSERLSLKDLKRFYENTLKKNVNLFELFHFFPKCERLICYFQGNYEDTLDAIITNFPRLKHLTLKIRTPISGYNWRNFGTNLTKLTSLELGGNLHHFCEYSSMIPYCPNLKKIELVDTIITDEWRKVIPKQVTDATFIGCKDARMVKGEGLLTNIFEDIHALIRLKWDCGLHCAPLNYGDVKVLTNVTHMTLMACPSVHAALFEWCKALEELNIGYLRLDDLMQETHILPKLRKLNVTGLFGNKNYLKLFCPMLVDYKNESEDDYYEERLYFHFKELDFFDSDYDVNESDEY